MKKRLSALLLALTLTCAALTACGDSSSTSAKTGNSSVKKAENWQETTTTTEAEKIDQIVYESQNFKVHYWGTELHFDNTNISGNYAAVKLKIDNNSNESTSVCLTPYSTVTINGIDLYADNDLISFTSKNSSDVGSIIIKENALKNVRVDKDNLKEITFAIEFKQSYVQGAKINEKSVEKSDKITVKV